MASNKLAKETKAFFSHYSTFAMNTSLDVVLCHEDEELCQKVFATAEKIVADYEQILSRYNPEAEVYRLNQNACQGWVKTSKKLWKAIALGIDFYERTNGYFNISLGRVFQSMKDGSEPVSYPNNNLIHKIELDATNQAVQFHDTMICLDFGGMGKGIALNEIGKIIDQNKIKNAFVSFGGSSILTRGHHPHGNYWPLGLRTNTNKEWKLNDAAISITGTHLEMNKTSVAHIVNPYILKTIKNGKTAIVKASNPIVAEVLSTALVAAPENLHAKILAAFHDATYEII